MSGRVEVDETQIGTEEGDEGDEPGESSVLVVIATEEDGRAWDEFEWSEFRRQQGPLCTPSFNRPSNPAAWCIRTDDQHIVEWDDWAMSMR